MDNKMKIFVIINILIIICSLLLIKYINYKSKDKLLDYSTTIATKFCKYIVNLATTDELADISNLYEVNKNVNGEIMSINYDTNKVNRALDKIVKLILDKFAEFENGESNIIDLSRNILLNEEIKDYRNGIIVELPLGLVTNNFLFNNLGPKIPIKISITGEIESSVQTSVTEYGINNALITITANIAVSQQILMPVGTKRITIHNQVPLSINVIQGVIPNYYLGGLESQSNIYRRTVEN